MSTIWKSLKLGKQGQPQVGGHFPPEKAAQMPMKPEMTSKTHERHRQVYSEIAEWENTNIRDGVTNNNEGCQNC